MASEFDRRAAYVSGLRELADFLEAHPELPKPSPCQINAFVTDKPALAMVARTPGVRWEKSISGNYFYLRVSFPGGHTYDVNVKRDQVCRKVVIGTRIEPAQPEREVEEVQWVCDEPLLAEGQAS